MNDGIGYAYTLAAAGNLGCGLAVLLPYQAMTLQAAFLHKGTSGF